MKKGIPIIDREKCKGCELCIPVCPKDILEVSSETNSQGVPPAVCIDENNCIGCCFCAEICPDMAIVIEEVK